MRALAFALFLLLLSSCAWPPAIQWPLEPASRRATSSASPNASKVNKAPRREKVRRLLQEEQYGAALNAIGPFRQGDLREEYLQAISAIVTMGGNELAAGDPARAGEHFRTALNHYPPDGQNLSKRLPMSEAGIEEVLGTCAEKLMEQGLKAYRAGKLDEAMAIWRRTLVFLPTHEPTRKAINTTQIQLDNLNALDQSRGPK